MPTLTPYCNYSTAISRDEADRRLKKGRAAFRSSVAKFSEMHAAGELPDVVFSFLIKQLVCWEMEMEISNVVNRQLDNCFKRVGKYFVKNGKLT